MNPPAQQNAPPVPPVKYFETFGKRFLEVDDAIEWLIEFNTTIQSRWFFKRMWEADGVFRLSNRQFRILFGYALLHPEDDPDFDQYPPGPTLFGKGPGASTNDDVNLVPID